MNKTFQIFRIALYRLKTICCCTLLVYSYFILGRLTRLTEFNYQQLLKYERFIGMRRTIEFLKTSLYQHINTFKFNTLYQLIYFCKGPMTMRTTKHNDQNIEDGNKQKGEPQTMLEPLNPLQRLFLMDPNIDELEKYYNECLKRYLIHREGPQPIPGFIDLDQISHKKAISRANMIINLLKEMTKMYKDDKDKVKRIQNLIGGYTMFVHEISQNSKKENKLVNIPNNEDELKTKNKNTDILSQAWGYLSSCAAHVQRYIALTRNDNSNLASLQRLKNKDREQLKSNQNYKCPISDYNKGGDQKENSINEESRLLSHYHDD